MSRLDKAVLAAAVLSLFAVNVVEWVWPDPPPVEHVCGREDQARVTVFMAACMCGEELWGQDGMPITSTPEAEACAREARRTACPVVP